MQGIYFLGLLKTEDHTEGLKETEKNPKNIFGP